MVNKTGLMVCVDALCRVSKSRTKLKVLTSQKRRYLYFFMLACFTIGSCQNGTRKNGTAKNEDDRMKVRFEWSPAAGTAHLYPMETVRCDFIFADGSQIGPVTKGISTDWGNDGGTAVIGDDMKPIPVALDICWLSYTEKKFYEGRFVLPYAKILQQFKDGFEDYTWTSDTERHLAHHTYDYIIVGIAPGGVVVLWLSGSGIQVEAGRFQAKETIGNMAKFIGREDVKVSKDAYIKDELSRRKKVTDNLAKNAIPYGLWDKYRERFNFRPVVKYDQPQLVKISDLSLEYFNGEKDNMYPDRIQKNEFSQKARVKEMRAVWTASVANKPMGYVLDINFDEAEMFKAYQEVYADNPNQPAEIVAEVNRDNDRYKVFLQGNHKKIALLKQKGQIYYDNSVK
jgi:hypothetical protein